MALSIPIIDVDASKRPFLFPFLLPPLSSYLSLSFSIHLSVYLYISSIYAARGRISPFSLLLRPSFVESIHGSISMYPSMYVTNVSTYLWDASVYLIYLSDILNLSFASISPSISLPLSLFYLCLSVSVRISYNSALAVVRLWAY